MWLLIDLRCKGKPCLVWLAPVTIAAWITTDCARGALANWAAN